MKGIAFLRAINVGGHVVKMDRLRALFGAAGFSSVETFIASGNVVFDLSPAKSTAALERAIEAMLLKALGYEVATFIRTGAELRAVAGHEPFSPAALKRSAAFNVAFVRQTVDAPSTNAILALSTAVDELHVHGREIYWLSRAKQSESRMSNAVFEKTLGRRSTVRGIATIRKMAERYGS